MITSDTNFRGNFDSIEAVWEAIPYGGVEGDYLNIQGVKYRWNKYLAMWENAEVVTETPARETVTFDEDVNMQNNLTVAGVLRAKKFVVDDLPTGIEEVEITESAVSGGTNVITFTYTNGESQTFNIKNGEAGKTMGAFGYASSTASQSTWNTAKNYLVPTANEGEFDVYTYEGDAWYQVDTFQVDIAGTAGDVEYDDTTTQLGADNVQEAIEALNDKTYPIDDALDETSELPVQNKVVSKEINNANAYLKTDVRVLAVGQVYALDEAVKTADGKMLRMTKEVKVMNTTDAVATGDLKTANSKTYKALYPISAYSSSADYSSHPYAVGRPSVCTITVDVSGFVQAGEISLTIGDATPDNIQVTTNSTAASIAADIVEAVGSIDGWTITDNEDGTITIKCNTAGANTLAFSFTDVDETGVVVSAATTAGANTISKYANGAWSAASVANMYGDTDLYQEVSLATLTSTYTAQDSISYEFGKLTRIPLLLSGFLPLFQRVIMSGQWYRLTNRYGRFIPVKEWDVFEITASSAGTCVYTILKDNYCDVNTAPNYAAGVSGTTSFAANQKRTVTITSSDAAYLYIECSTSGTTGRPPAKIIKTNGVIREDVGANTKDIAKINNELFTQELFDIAYADVTASLPTSYMIVARVGTQVTTTATKSGFILRTIYSSPTWNLVVGRKYKLSFDVINNTGKTVSVRWGNSNQEAVSRFLTIANGFEGTKEYEFTYGSGMGQFSFAFTPSATDVTLVVDNISWVNITDLERINENTQEITALDGRVTTLERGETPQATTKSEYVGDVFPYPKKHYIGSTRLAYGGASNYKQGADQYNGYVFQFDDFNRSLFNVFIYNLSQPAFLTTITPTRLSTFHQGAHCNEVCFSRKFYDAEDTFPLLYVSSGASAIYNYAQVYRIQQSENTFTITQVQEIAFPATIGGVTVQWMQIYIDNGRNAIWQTYETGGKYRFNRYAIPATTEENVTLTESNILETFDTEKGSSNQQGGVIYDNKLYLAVGSSTDANPPAIDVFDLSAKCKIVRGFNLRALGVFTGELESVFFYEDNMYGIGQGMDGVYRFYFGG